MKQGNRATLGVPQNIRRVWGAVCIAAFLTGAGAACSQAAVTTYTKVGEPAAVSKYKTFGVVLPDSQDLKEEQMKPENMKRLADLFVERMQSLGYQPIAADQADLLIGLSPEARLYGPLRVVNESSRGGGDHDLDEKFDGEGKLTVSFVDVRAKSLVLTRVAQARVNARLGEEQMQEITASVFDGMPRAAEGAAPPPP